METFKTYLKGKRKASRYRLEDEFRIIGDLGEGAFAVVKLAVPLADPQGPPVAIKIIPLETIRRTMGLDRDALMERREWLLRVNQRMAHPNVVRLYGYRISEDHYYGLMEVFRGGELFDRIAAAPDGHLTEEEARRVTQKLLLAVDALHRNGIIHRDIKPENAMLRAPGSAIDDAVLIDFGCSIVDVKPGQYFVGAAGSPGYVAPEMAAGEPYNHLVDIFSLGICVYSMLTGRSPFLSSDPDDLRREVIFKNIPFPQAYWRNISPGAKKCVQRMLAKRPEDRWSAAELLDEDAWLAERPPASQRPSYGSANSGIASSGIGSSASSMTNLSLTRSLSDASSCELSEVDEVDEMVAKMDLRASATTARVRLAQ